MIIYDVSRAIVRTYARLWHRITILGEERIPATGIFIASSHGSYLDPPLLGSYAGPHRVSFIAKRELRDWPLIGRWMVACRTLFIRRGGVNRELEEQAIQLAQDGGCVCVFPEGTRTRTGALGTGKAGVGKLFLRTGIPVVPAYIDGNFRAYPPGGVFPRPVKLTIRYGEPLTFPLTENPAKEQCQQAVDAVMAAITRLRDEHTAARMP
jgi:1-acyl-sn-glycerol-3-phosphate acyltransferase